VSKAALETAVLENGLVKSSVELNKDEENPISPLDNFSEMNFEQQVVGKSKWENFIRRALKFVRSKILNVLFPNGIVYHSGQFDILTRVQRSGIPLLFVNLGNDSATNNISDHVDSFHAP
jgi:hypothetical protein